MAFKSAWNWNDVVGMPGILGDESGEVWEADPDGSTFFAWGLRLGGVSLSPTRCCDDSFSALLHSCLSSLLNSLMTEALSDEIDWSEVRGSSRGFSATKCSKLEASFSVINFLVSLCNDSVFEIAWRIFSPSSSPTSCIFILRNGFYQRNSR